MPQPPQPLTPKTFLDAALQPRSKQQTHLLGDMWDYLKNHKLEFLSDATNAVLDVPEALAGTVLNAGQSLVNTVTYPFTGKGVHIPGAFHPAPKTPRELNNQTMSVLSLGLKDVYDKKLERNIALHDPTRKNPDGTLATLEDDVEVYGRSALETIDEVVGVTPMKRAMSNTYDKPVKGSERIADFGIGATSFIATITGLRSLMGAKPPGTSLMEQQAAERAKEAARVKTVGDVAKGLGVESSDDLLAAARGETTIEQIVEAQNKNKIQEFREAMGAKKGTPMTEGIPDASVFAYKKAGQSSKVIDNKIINDAGVSMKMLDGTEMFIDVVDPASDLAKRMQQTQLDQAILSVPEIEAIALKARQSDMLKQLRQLNPDFMDNHLIAASVANGVLGPEWIGKYAKELGVAPEVAQQQLVNHLVHTATTSSKTMKAFNLGAEAAEAFSQMEEWFGQKTAGQILSGLSELGNKPIMENVKVVSGVLNDLASSLVAKQKKAVGKMVASPKAKTTYGWLMNASRMSTKSMLSFIGTPARNFENALGMANGIAGFEDMLVDAAQRVGGAMTGAIGAGYGAEARRSVLANQTFDFAKMLMGRGELAKGMSKMVDAIPSTSQYLRGSASQLMGHLAELHSVGIPFVDHTLNAYAQVLNSISTFAAMPMRQGIYGARVVKNVEAIKHWKDIVKNVPEANTPLGRLAVVEDWAKDPRAAASKYGLTEAQMVDVDSDLRMAMGDAKIHTLKNELGFATEPVQKFVDFYHSIPFADTIGPTFPKMVYNTWRWTMEHNPINLFSIVDDKFRETLMAGAEGGFKTRAAQRDYAKAVSGAAMLGLAYGMRSGMFEPIVSPGSRPHEMKTGDITHDVRSFSPIDKYLVMGGIMHDVAGKGMSVTEALARVTPAELADLAIGQRRLGDVPILGLEKYFSDITSGNTERMEERGKKLIGDFVGRFSVPMRNAKLITDLLRPSDQGMPDMNNAPLTAPTLSHMPGPIADAMGQKFTLPKRIDATIGKAMGVDHPVLTPILQIMGSKIETLPKLTEELQRLNFPTYLLVGNNGDERLDRAVALNMGKILKEPIMHQGPTDAKPISMPLGEYLAGPAMDLMAQAHASKNIEDPVFKDSQKIEKLKELFGGYRIKALKMAYADYPQLLTEAKIQAMPDMTTLQKEALMRELFAQGLLDTPSPQTPNTQKQNKKQ